MPKFNPTALPAIVAQRHTKTFTAKNGEEFTLCISLTSGGEVAFAILDKREELIDQWLDNGPSAPQSSPVKVSKTLCFLIARLLVLQAPADGETEEDLWQFPAWAFLSQRDPVVFSQINAWVSGLITEGDSPNSSPASPPESKGGAGTSLPQPSTTEDATPTS